jgi:hypothetical protein
MLNLLFDWLKSLGLDIPGAGLLNYLSFRAMAARANSPSSAPWWV